MGTLRMNMLRRICIIRVDDGSSMWSSRQNESVTRIVQPQCYNYVMGFQRSISWNIFPAYYQSHYSRQVIPVGLLMSVRKFI